MISRALARANLSPSLPVCLSGESMRGSHTSESGRLCGSLAFPFRNINSEGGGTEMQ